MTKELTFDPGTNNECLLEVAKNGAVCMVAIAEQLLVEGSLTTIPTVCKGFDFNLGDPNDGLGIIMITVKADVPALQIAEP